MIGPAERKRQFVFAAFRPKLAFGISLAPHPGNLNQIPFNIQIFGGCINDL
jgi:hypothetical protein